MVAPTRASGSMAWQLGKVLRLIIMDISHIRENGWMMETHPYKGGATSDPNGILSENLKSSQHDKQQLVPIIKVVTTNAQGWKGKLCGMLLRGIIPHSSIGLMMHNVYGDVVSYQGGFWEYRQQFGTQWMVNRTYMKKYIMEKHGWSKTT
jgi:hypothetical protein